MSDFNPLPLLSLSRRVRFLLFVFSASMVGGCFVTLSNLEISNEKVSKEETEDKIVLPTRRDLNSDR